MLWIKAFHIIAVVCWFAMLFYLPRLFVYHAMTDDQATKERFKIMERKLYRGIGTPSLIGTVVFGVWLVIYDWPNFWNYYSSVSWFWIKIALVVLLIGYHHVCGAYVKRFARDEVDKSHIYFRWFNEFPTVILISVVILVVVKQPV